MKIEIGDIVTSKAGRDIGYNYVVWNIEGNLLYLVNGKQRKIANPKKKKSIHVVFSKKSNLSINKIKEKININDAYLRKVLNSQLVKGEFYE